MLDPAAAFIEGLRNDSKQIAEKAKRPAIADEAKRSARRFLGRSQPLLRISISSASWLCLKRAFKTAVINIEAQGIVPEVILLDGNPLGFDAREINVVEGGCALCLHCGRFGHRGEVERDALYGRIRSGLSRILTSLHRRGMAARRIVALSQRRGSPLFIVFRIARTSQRIVRFRVNQPRAEFIKGLCRTGRFLGV